MTLSLRRWTCVCRLVCGFKLSFIIMNGWTAAQNKYKVVKLSAQWKQHLTGLCNLLNVIKNYYYPGELKILGVRCVFFWFMCSTVFVCDCAGPALTVPIKSLYPHWLFLPFYTTIKSLKTISGKLSLCALGHLAVWRQNQNQRLRSTAHTR